jgi:hypothetical protein
MEDRDDKNLREVSENEAEYEADFREVEIGRLSEAEYELANLQHQTFLEKERIERERLDREFEDELNQLLKTLKSEDDDTAKGDPPGWPGL